MLILTVLYECGLQKDVEGEGHEGQNKPPTYSYQGGGLRVWLNISRLHVMHHTESEIFPMPVIPGSPFSSHNLFQLLPVKPNNQQC